MEIRSVEALRTLYAAPGERALRKQMTALDRHCRRFVELSPFLVMATVGANGAMDVSPRGGAPGFVRVLDDSTLLLPDAPGNHRLDSLTNLVETGRIALLFFVPGVDETLRVQGRATLSTAPDDLARCADERRTPKVVVRVTPEEVYLHCAKALMRSRLWDPEAKVERNVLPTLGEMLRDQTGSTAPPESQQAMLERYAPEL